MECISLFIFVREYYRGSVGRGCFVYFILEVGEILVRGVGAEAFYKFSKIHNHVCFCDGMCMRVGVWCIRSKSLKAQK